MLSKLFAPKSVALIGASSTPGKLGFDILANLVESSYAGKIYPVNPHAKEILGKKTYVSVKKIKEPIDLALIAVPPPSVADVLAECARQGIHNAVIITAGFKEIGGEGEKREKEIQKIAQKKGIRIIGPNCLGLINTHLDFNGSFTEGMPRKGNIALVSQSGAMAVAITDWAFEEDIGFSSIVSLGNKVDVTENECLEYLENDKKTSVILVYLESFANGEKFMEIASGITRKKPIILLKAGVTEAGIKAVSSHTGSLAGADIAVESAMKQCGVTRVYSIEAFFDCARVFSMQPIPKGNRIAIVTNAGGPGVMATDDVERTDLKVANFNKKTIKELEKCLPITASVHNPVDIVGDARADRYDKALGKVLKDPNVDILLTILTPQIMTEKEQTVRLIAQYNQKNPNKTFVTSFMGGHNIEYSAEKLREHDIPNFLYPNRAVKAVEKMVQLHNWRQVKASRKYDTCQGHGSKKFRHSFLKKTILSKKRQLDSQTTRKLLKAYDIQVPELKLAKNKKDAIRYASEMQYPVVLKISSDEVLHKTDVGGVRIDLNNEDEVGKAYEQIIKNVKKRMPKAKIEGVMVQKMVYFGREVIIGMKRDPVFGPLIMFGLGGIYVEVMKDVSFRVAPFCLPEAEKMIHEVKAIQLLKGVRGEAPADIKKLAETVLCISQLAMDFPEIQELDINPLMVMKKGKGVVAIDARFIV